MRIRSVAILFVLFLSASCTDKLIHEEFGNTPLGNFDACWSEYDRNYGAFEAKNINWDSLRSIYRSKLNNESTDEELYTVLTGLMKHLNDGHVQLLAPGFKRFFSSEIHTLYRDSKYYENGNVINALLSLIANNYLQTLKLRKSFFRGYIKNQISSKRIAYLYVSSFSLDLYPRSFIDSALTEFKSADAIILDLRFNGGGATGTFLNLLNHFADERRMYLKSKLRNGPNHIDFTELYSHYTWPEYGVFSSKPVIVLVNRFSGSSSEHFMLGMQKFPYVTTIGDTTYGALSTVMQKMLPNGWEFRICPQVIYDINGRYLSNADGRYPDGVGLCPQIWIPNYYKDIVNGRDLVLERAIKVINTSK